MTRPAAFKDCTPSCEAFEECAVCHRRKKPRGRDSMDNGLCDQDCHGYLLAPEPGHLWPGEIARMDEPGSDLA